jgi:hypothetical protein
MVLEQVRANREAENLLEWGKLCLSVRTGKRQGNLTPEQGFTGACLPRN